MNILKPTEIKSLRKAKLIIKKRDYSKYNQKQLKLGIQIEKEHTDNIEIARKIAADHLDEVSDYYTRLIAMEKKAKKEK